MKSYKRYLARTAGLLIAGSVLPATAADSSNMAACKDQIKRLYGEQTRVKLKGIQRSSQGDKMRIVALPGDGESYRTTCWIDREGELNLVDRDGADLLASAPEEGDQVTMNN